MNIEAVVLLLFALILFLLALLCCWVLIVAYRTQVEVRQVAHEINSRMDQLLDERGRSERAAGRAEGPQEA